MGLHVKNFMKIKASPPKNSIFFHSTPKGILDFYILHSLLKKKNEQTNTTETRFSETFSVTLLE